MGKPLSPLRAEEEEVGNKQEDGRTSSNKKRHRDPFSYIEHEHHLYFTLLGVPRRALVNDMLLYLLIHLNYYLKRIVKEHLLLLTKKPADDDDFEATLVGPPNQRPFQATHDNNLRYDVLLQFVESMRMRPMDVSATLRCQIYTDLLSECEAALIKTLRKSGANYTQEEEDALLLQVRSEILDFLDDAKIDNDTKIGDGGVFGGTFTNLLRADTYGSLDELDLEDQHFPALDNWVFDLSRPCPREKMALRLFVLDDLHQKFLSKIIGKFTPELTKAAFKLIYSRIQQNVASSLTISCGDIVVDFPGQSEQAIIVELDPPPSMSKETKVCKVF